MARRRGDALRAVALALVAWLGLACEPAAPPEPEAPPPPEPHVFAETGLCEVPRGRGPEVPRLAPRPGDAGAHARDGPRRFRRQRVRTPRVDDPLPSRWGSFPRGGRGRRRRDGDLRGGLHVRRRAAPAVPARVSEGPVAEPDRRLGHGEGGVVSPCIPKSGSRTTTRSTGQARCSAGIRCAPSVTRPSSTAGTTRRSRRTRRR